MMAQAVVWCDAVLGQNAKCLLACNPIRLTRLREDCCAALHTMRMPSNRQEEYRFTDLSSILKARIQVRLFKYRAYMHAHLSYVLPCANNHRLAADRLGRNLFCRISLQKCHES